MRSSCSFRGFHAYIHVKQRRQLSTWDGDGGPVCDQPSQRWRIGLTTYIWSYTMNSNFTNEVRISVISADPIQCETWNPAGGGFCRRVEIQPDPDSRSGYPSIPNHHHYYYYSHRGFNQRPSWRRNIVLQQLVVPAAVRKLHTKHNIELDRESRELQARNETTEYCMQNNVKIKWENILKTFNPANDSICTDLYKYGYMIIQC